MVDADLSYFPLTVNDVVNTSLVIDDTLTVEFRDIAKRSFQPQLPDPPFIYERTYDLTFGTRNEGGSPLTVNIDGIPFTYNTQDFDNNNEILFTDELDVSVSSNIFFDSMQVSSKGPEINVDLIISGEPLGTSDVDVLVKRFLIDENFASTNPNPFFTQSLPSTFFGMASNPVYRADQIIAYDYILLIN